MLNKLAILTLLLSACTADSGSDFEDVPDEAELSPAEQAELPDGLEPEHTDDLAAALSSEAPEDDASLFDDDEVAPMIDVEVDVAAAPAPLLKAGLHPRA